MALSPGSRLPVSNRDVFPHGCCLVPDSITEVQDYDERTRRRTPSVDKLTGQRVWQCRVSDLDPELAGPGEEMTPVLIPPSPREGRGPGAAPRRCWMGDRRAAGAPGSSPGCPTS
jgi:hypothetical protein